MEPFYIYYTWVVVRFQEIRRLFSPTAHERVSGSLAILLHYIDASGGENLST
jgi:hypothetical protein